MKWVRSPAVWFPIALLLLVGCGARLLWMDGVLQLSERERSAYDEVNEWRVPCDALSAVCGVGLFRFDLHEHYTPAGHWLLALLGVAGAVLYLAAARQVIGLVWPGVQLPRGWMIVLAFFAVQVLAIPLCAAGAKLAGAQLPLGDAALNAITTTAALGWVRGAVGERAGVYAALALLAAVGWPSWLVWRRAMPWRPLAGALGSYLVLLAIAAVLVASFEAPRGVGQRGGGEAAARTFEARLGPATAQVVAAAGAGLQTESIADRGLSEGSKFVLSAIVMIGGFGGGVTGGAKWLVVLWVLAAMFAPRKCCASEGGRRGAIAAAAVGASMLLWGWIVAVGLLLIETQVGSRFQSPPTFADALVDAASLTAGAGLTSGLLGSLTAPTLSSGIRLSVDLYQYGMAWALVAMFVGRVLPVLVLARMVRLPAAHMLQLPAEEAPVRLPPLI